MNNLSLMKLALDEIACVANERGTFCTIFQISNFNQRKNCEKFRNRFLTTYFSNFFVSINICLPGFFQDFIPQFCQFFLSFINFLWWHHFCTFSKMPRVSKSKAQARARLNQIQNHLSMKQSEFFFVYSLQCKFYTW